jgi:hypothetical protein
LTERPSRADAIVMAARALLAAAPTATGATILAPDGELIYLSIETAREALAHKPAERPQ